jgi:UDP-3-O-[3-hydroxymyristoyl] glucosamine N-acyltransferase
MEYSVKEIADMLGGKVEGDGSVMISKFARIEYGEPGAISFLANPKYEQYIYTSKASAVIVNNSFEPHGEISATLIRVPDAYKSVADLLHIYAVKQTPKGHEMRSKIHRTAKVGKGCYIGGFAYIDKNAVLGDNVQVHPLCYVGKNVKIGDNTILYPGVKIYYDCEIGKNCIIHSNTVIGADGFGFAPNPDGEFEKIEQIGNVVIEDNVELGALVTIDRAIAGSTIIRSGVKLDDHNHVAHNVEIGKNTVMAAQGGIAGSAKIGENCMFGGQVGIGPHSNIANRTKMQAKAGIAGTVKEENTALMGAPAMDARKYQRLYVRFKQLDDMAKKIEMLEKQIEELKKKGE